MAEDTLIIPPIRQSVEDVTSAQKNGIAQPLTEKSWYLYWNRLGQMANRQALMITYGTHADRPDADLMPDGALYIESDRGNVIYEKIDSAWHYVAGTMWDTLSPDHRPTDLGQADSNFDYRGTDQVREYIWTGYTWVDATSALYGTHAQRLALTVANQMDTQLYAETDRGNVIYQIQGGQWHYVAGVMTGTLSPDQRPTDLGANDVRFTFRSTDQPLVQFAWNGSAWIQITGASATANYLVNGTLIGSRAGLNLIAGSNVTISGSDNSGANRVDVTVASSGGGGSGGAVSSVFGRTGAVVAQAGDYAAYEVTNAVDQTSSYTNPAWILSLAWSKITGAPAFLVSPLATKGDLMAYGTANSRLPVGTNNQVLTADSSQTLGVKWATPAGVPSLQYATCSSNLTLTGSYQAIPGLSLSLSRAGTYLIQASICFVQQGESGMYMFVVFTIGGVNQTPGITFQPGSSTVNEITNGFQQLSYVVGTPPQTVIVQAFKNGGAGTSYISANHSTLSATWVSP